MKYYDEHDACRKAIHEAYEAAKENCRIKEVIQEMGDGTRRVLTIIRIDTFQDGVHIVVR